MKIFTAVSLVLLLCCLEAALSYPNPAAPAKAQEDERAERDWSFPPEHKAKF